MKRRSLVIGGTALFGHTVLRHSFPFSFSPPSTAPYPIKPASRCYRQFTFDFNWVGGEIKDYFTKVDPVAYADFCKQINLDAVVLMAVSHHGYCSYETAVGEKWPAMRRDWFREQIEELHKRGIAAIAYITLARNWKYMNEHPKYTWPRGGERFICLNSPYMDLVIAYTQEVLKNYPVDALRYDTLEQAPDHHCEGCQAYYRELYAEELPAQWKEEDWRRQLDFQRASSTRAVERLQKIAKETKGSIETWQNGFIETGRFDENDLNAGRMQDVAYVEFGDPFRQLLLQGVLNLKGIIVGRILESPVRRVCMALGAHCYSYSRVNRETLLPDDTSWFVDDLAPFYRMVSEVQAYLEAAKPLAYFGIVYCEATRYRNYMYDRREYIKLLRDITESYLNRSLPLEFVNALDLPTEDLARFKVLVLPETSGLKSTEVEGLRKYVREGGQLLLTGAALLYDEKGLALSDFALAKEMGVNLVSKPAEEVELKFSEGWANKYLPMTTNPKWWPNRRASPYVNLTAITRVQAREGETVVTANLDGQPWPIVHLNRYGKGTIAYSALSHPQELLETIIETMAGSVPLLVANGKMAVLTHQPDLRRWILHLIGDGDLQVSLNKAWGTPDKIVGQYPKEGFEYQVKKTADGVTIIVQGEVPNRLLVLVNE